MMLQAMSLNVMTHQLPHESVASVIIMGMSFAANRYQISTLLK